MDGEVSVEPIPVEHKSVLRNLLELCQHDYSEFNGEEISEHGLFGYPYLDHYWTEAGRHPLFVRLAGKLAGFALVRTLAAQDAGEPVCSLAEFFILRKYRRQGVGRRAAILVFDLFPGRWRVGQERGNDPAQLFWHKVIADYTQGQFDEVSEVEDGYRVQTFHVSV